MKTELLKKLIKEAVREALKEELRTLYETVNLSQNSSFSKNLSLEEDKIDQNPSIQEAPKSINEILNVTRKSMTREDFHNVLGSSLKPGSSEFTFDTNSSIGSSQPGLNLNNLGFVKNAAAVFNKAVEKEKNRFG